MSHLPHDEKAYAFRFDGEQHGWSYYRTISLWSGFGEHGRDLRKPHPVIVASFLLAMDRIGQSWRWATTKAELALSIGIDGWVLLPQQFADVHLANLLAPRKTLKSPLGLFWDVDIPRNRATNHRVKGNVRDCVLARDGHKCVECSRSEADGVSLTMDHVIPFSRGGETSEGNLVTLCEDCNQDHANDHHPHLFALAGLHSGWDPGIFGDIDPACPVEDVLTAATMMSQNILVSRCRAEELGSGDNGGPL
jgi:HNH endonuclease